MRILLAALSFAFAAAAMAQQAPKDDPAPATPEQVQQQRQLTQPGNNAPVWREVQRGEPNYTSIPGREMNVLIQPPARFLGQDVRVTAGEAWRQFRNGPVTFWGGWLVVLVCLVIAALYFVKGPVKLHEPPTGRMLPRFNQWERVVHWSVAISFCVLGLSGLIMLFGKHVLLPIMGYTLFAWLTMLCKNLHNFVAPFFMVSVLIMVLMWAKDNLWRSYDWRWIVKMPAFFLRGEHIPSGRFNGMEKVWFWGFVVVLSVVMSWSGLILLFPNFDQTRATMQDAWVWHAGAAIAYIAMSLGHIYMGTIGVEGAYKNMREGVTDETWAKEHHSIWYDEVKAGKRPDAARGAIPAGAPHMKDNS
jgi:formate dehydrogenase subunit gamma